MYYGLYKNVRNAAWQCLIDFNICTLPVDVLSISNAANIKIIKNSNIDVLKPNESGACYLDTNQWYIVYNDKEIVPRKRFTIAHELGHIFLGHPLKSGHFARTIDTSLPGTETEANVFASRLLAPSCVLWGLDLYTAQEIAHHCNISMSAAQIRADRMMLLRKRNMFLSNPLEKAVYKQFEQYISTSKGQ